MYTNSEAFLKAFTRVEKYLRRRVGGKREDGFSHLVSEASSKLATVRRFADDLREFADLRNAIVHERRGGVPIAEPHPETVKELERIADLLEDPPRADSFISTEVVTTMPSAPVGTAARQMLEGDFSQLPVYRGQEYVGLLTSGAVARWLANELDRHGGMLEDQPVEAVLEFRESQCIEKFVPRRKVVAEIIDLFEQTVRSGRQLDAVIVTESGDRNEKPLGILTSFDLPQLFELGLGGR